jgi:pimeloyl-ACP methyl ester carboxylesterase
VLDDARAVLRYAKERPEVDSNRVVLIGHSQGGLVALELAAGDPDVRGIVLLAAPGRSADRVLEDQIREEGKLLHLDAAVIRKRLEEFALFVSLVRSGENWDSARIPERFRPARNTRVWYADLLARDPVELLSRVICPVLICQGTKDLQVSAERDATVLAEAARRQSIPYRLALFPDLDHLFMPTPGKPDVAEYYRARHVAPELIRVIEAFLVDISSEFGAGA